MKKIFPIGTRGSLLALAQAKEIQRRLKSKYPRMSFPLAIVKTTGDEFQSVEVFKKKSIGVFTKAIEEKLMKKRVDIAIHSLKDLPTDLPRGLCLACFPKRSYAGDALVSRGRWGLRSLPKGASVATGSPRRKRQLHRLRPDLRLYDLRGNLDTRMKKILQEKKYDAVVLADAGLKRLGRYLKYARRLSASQMLPAVGQGALGIEARRDDAETLKLLKFLNHLNTEREVLAERAFLKTLKGGCRVPVGIYSKIKDKKIHLKASVFSIHTSEFVTDEASGPARAYERLGKALAQSLLRKGAHRFLKEARAHAK